MKLAVSPQILALGTALAWGIGGFFEKKGLLLGDLSPQIGITVRTGVALLILAAVSFPQWKTLLSAEPRVWLYMILGGGVLAGAVGILFASEPLTPKTIIGMGLTVGGIVVLSI